MNKSKLSLADKIAGVLNAAPTSFDPEDDVHEETTAKVIDNDLEEDDEEEAILSKFRKQNIDLLEDVDHRYAGKKSSRKDLKESDEDSEGDEAPQSNEDDESDDESDQQEEEDEDYDESGEDLEEPTVDLEDNFKHLSASDPSIHLNKGLCIKNQLNIWESLLEMRIQLQKCLITSNKMPAHNVYTEIKSSAPEFAQKAAETKKTLASVLNKMLDLQGLMIKKYPETKKLLSGQVEKKVESDEEIPSDSEQESEAEVEDSPKKKRKIGEFESEISNVHNLYKTYRNSTIQKWNDKTRIATGKNTTGHSALNQIEHNLSDRSKLIKRTQLKRSEYEIIGGGSTESSTEIFDDDDFYHQLLRELIEVKSADLTDPVQLGRQWIQLQSMRSKMKRKIDTKATKGRKIRYTVHTKLVNFMAPIDESSWTDEAKTELYSSLFGKNHAVKSV